MPDGKKLPAGFIPDGFVPDAPAQQAKPAAAAPLSSGNGADTDAITFGGMQRNADPELNKQLTKFGATTVGAMAAPELLPEMAGGGILSFLGKVLSRAAMSGLGAGAGNTVGQAATGEKPLSVDSLKESGRVAAYTAALSAPLEAIGGIPASKIGRSLINKGMDVAGRDMSYSNPARAILKEDITDIGMGDWNAYQEALRSGKTVGEASQAAGGRFAAVNQRINELSPRLDNLLTNSPARIPTRVVTDKLDASMMDIINNPALTHDEQVQAFDKLFSLKQALTNGRGADMSAVEAQGMKQAIGDRVKWGGNAAVTDDVKAAYRQVYGALKEAIHRNVPGTADLDNRLSDLLGAQDTLTDLVKGEEAGKIPFTVTGLGQKEAGRIMPKLGMVEPPIPGATGASGATILQQLLAKGRIAPQQQNQPGLPFSPGAGIPKP